MKKRFPYGLLLALCTALLGCSSGNPASAGTAGLGAPHAGTSSVAGTSSAGKTGGVAGTSVVAVAGTVAIAGTGVGGVAGSGAVGAAGKMAVAGSGGAGALAAGVGGAAGSAGKAGAASSAGAGGSSAGGSSVTGTLGALGPVQPILNAWATTNGPETLIYLTTATLTCADMMTMGVKWLSKLPAGSQVIEIIVPGSPTTKSYTIGFPDRGEVNYAQGSTSSRTEVTGSAGTIMFTNVVSKMVYEGTINVTAPFSAMGMFHAEWCQGGAEF
jgi:hypothetical protein